MKRSNPKRPTAKELAETAMSEGMRSVLPPAPTAPGTPKAIADSAWSSKRPPRPRKKAADELGALIRQLRGHAMMGEAAASAELAGAKVDVLVPPGLRVALLRHVGEIDVPLRTGRGLNAREHWAARQRRVAKEHHATSLGVKSLLRGRVPQGSLVVTLTRIGPGAHRTDDDQTVGALKGVRDAVAEALGVDDGDRARVRWAYAQQRGPWGVRIRIDEEVAP